MEKIIKLNKKIYSGTDCMDINYNGIIRDMKNISFNTPLYECISNSIEAGATNILIKINLRNNIQPNTIEEHIKQYSTDFIIDNIVVEDNGIGFNAENIKSFNTYRTEYKQQEGCKGVGRFTWLKIFENVEINSYTQDKYIHFNFNTSYQDSAIEQVDNKTNLLQTSITLMNIKKQYEKYALIDKNEIINYLNNLRDDVLKYFAIKLHLLRQKNKSVNITIKIDHERVSINSNNLPELEKVIFKMKTSYNDMIDFNIYYYISDELKGSIDIFLCANGRTVQYVKDRESNLSVLPDNKHMIVLVESLYFDDNVNSDRGSFEFPTKGTTEEFIDIQDIKKEILNNVSNIIYKKYPNITIKNQEIIENIKNEYPYLSKYVEQEKAVILTQDFLLKNSMKRYEDDKSKIRKNIKNFLSKNKINEIDFDKIADEISDIQARQLAEYVLFRQSIIDSFKKIIGNKFVEEKVLHNLILQQGYESESFNLYNNNIWMLDDKFTTFNYIASDKSIKAIKQALKDETADFDARKEPDIAIFYSKPDNNSLQDSKKDAVIIELKGIGTRNKAIAITELPKNMMLIRQNLQNINQLWGYIIMELDDKICNDIEAQSRYKKFFSNGKPIYYDYYTEPTNAMVYIMDYDSLINDADSRNKVFLDIIRNNHKL